jgi:hypothetical protein
VPVDMDIVAVGRVMDLVEGGLPTQTKT